MTASKTQVDRLGDRLKAGEPTEADLRMLDDYRRSFGDAYGAVVSTIRDQLKLEPTGRPEKSTASIVDKLQRESIRLSQIQDIAGCRLIVQDVAAQDTVVSALVGALPTCTIVDRRKMPSHGYRAVHAVANDGNRLVEIQVRTEMQHLWAETSEKLSDVLDPSIKYGGGEPEAQNLLATLSASVFELEELEQNRKTLPDDIEGKAALSDKILRVRSAYQTYVRSATAFLDSREGSE